MEQVSLAQCLKMLDLQKVKQLEILALCQLRRQLRSALSVRDALECEEPAPGAPQPTNQIGVGQKIYLDSMSEKTLSHAFESEGGLYG